MADDHRCDRHPYGKCCGGPLSPLPYNMVNITETPPPETQPYSIWSPRTWEYKWVVATVFVLGLFMDILDTTIVNVAIPTLAREFKVTANGIEWVVTGYLLSLAVFIPASGWIGDRFGTKRTFLFALTVFTLSSALCATAWSVGSLTAFRVIQGVGGGMLTPVGTAMLFRAFPPRERAAASTVLTIPTVLAPAMGPVLGGFLVTKISWHWIFLVNIPIGVIGLVFGAVFLREHREGSTKRFDAPGFVLSGAGLALVLLALSEGPRLGWRSTTVVASAIFGVASFALLVRRELRIPNPILDLRLLGNRLFRATSLASFMSSGGLIGLLFLLPIFLQSLRGLSALQSGLTTFPQAFGVIIASRFVGRMYQRVGPRRLLAVGLGGIAAATALFLLVDLHTSLWWIRLIMFVRGLFFACSIISLQAASFATISPADTGRASSLYSTVRQVGSAFGVAILATVLSTRTNTRVTAVARAGTNAIRSARVSAFHDAFLAGIVIALLGMLCALTIRDADAAASMTARPG